MKISRLHHKTLGAAIIAGVVCAGLGMLSGFLIMGDQIQSPRTENIEPYQNFALVTGAVAGSVIGGGVAVLWVRWARGKYQYPASSGLGGRLGAAAGFAANLITASIVYAGAPAYDYTRSSPVGFGIEIFVTTLVAVVCGLVAGYLLADIGGRDLSYLT